MKRFLLAAMLLASLVIPSYMAPSASAANCNFVLGFQTLHDMIPDVVGDCKVNQHYNPQNGDALQETTGGMLVWRKADNFTAFTDGYRSWVNGPYGMQQRLNTERFGWEDDGQGAPRTSPTTPPPTVPIVRPAVPPVPPDTDFEWRKEQIVTSQGTIFEVIVTNKSAYYKAVSVRLWVERSDARGTIVEALDLAGPEEIEPGREATYSVFGERCPGCEVVQWRVSWRWRLT